MNSSILQVRGLRVNYYTRQGAVPAVNDLPAGWVTALDLPLIPGAGTIR